MGAGGYDSMAVEGNHPRGPEREATMQRATRGKEAADHRAAQRKAKGDLAENIANSPLMVAQRQRIDRLFGNAIRRTGDELPKYDAIATVRHAERVEQIPEKTEAASPAQRKEEVPDRPQTHHLKQIQAGASNTQTLQAFIYKSSDGEQMYQNVTSAIKEAARRQGLVLRQIWDSETEHYYYDKRRRRLIRREAALDWAMEDSQESYGYDDSSEYVEAPSNAPYGYMTPQEYYDHYDQGSDHTNLQGQVWVCPTNTGHGPALWWINPVDEERMRLTGNREDDKAILGFYPGFTWHHCYDYDQTTGECTMQLVDEAQHNSWGHVGGAYQAGY